MFLVVKRPALFLDRDGVINEEVSFLHRPEQVRFVPGIFSLLRTAQHLGYRLVVVTNQSGIGRGLYSEDDFQRLMQWIAEQLADQEIFLDKVYHCPHHPTDGVGGYRRECADRKPGPGMFLRAAKDLDLDLAKSVLVGDRLSDMQAGEAAGVGKRFLLSSSDRPDPLRNTGFERMRSLQGIEERLQTFANYLPTIGNKQT